MAKRFALCIFVLLLTLAIPSSAPAASVFDGEGKRVGKVQRAGKGKFSVYRNGRKVGSGRTTSPGRWSISGGGSVRQLTSRRCTFDRGLTGGYVRKAGGRWRAFSDSFEKLGEIRGGSCAAAAGAALLLLA